MTLLKLALNKLERTLDFTTNQVMYAQEGEDHILRNHFKDKKDGFFVDVGAFHPKHLSNTAYLYQQGWKGINIEPMKDRFELFIKERKRDININRGVGLKEGYHTFYNTSSAFSSFIKPKISYKKEKVYVRSLGAILEDAYLNKDSVIDLLCIDTEGKDLDVLKSNDWNLFKPKVILVETAVNERKIVRFLKSKGYKPKYRTCLNTIFVRD